jgi:hypothetical protein
MLGALILIPALSHFLLSGKGAAQPVSQPEPSASGA